MAKVDSQKTGELTFDQFKEAMDLIEVLLDQSEDEEGDDEDDDEVIDVTPEPTKSSAGKGFSAKAVENPPQSAGKGASKNPTKMSLESDSSLDSEAEQITREMFDELRGKRKTVSVVSTLYNDTKDSFNPVFKQ